MPSFSGAPVLLLDRHQREQREDGKQQREHAYVRVVTMPLRYGKGKIRGQEDANERTATHVDIPSRIHSKTYPAPTIAVHHHSVRWRKRGIALIGALVRASLTGRAWLAEVAHHS